MRQSTEQMRQRISATIIELMDCGGTMPMATYHVLVEETPEVLDGFPEQELIDLCDQIQRSEVPEKSREFQALFREFNLEYFGGRLPDYEIRVVFDVDYWAGCPFHGETGLHQPELRRMLIRIAEDIPQMVSTLIHLMAHVGGDGNHDGRWLDEMRRLRKAGAPVGNLLIDWGPSV